MKKYYYSLNCNLFIIDKLVLSLRNNKLICLLYFSPVSGSSSSSEGYMDAYGPRYSNGLALEEGQDYSDTEAAGEDYADSLFESYEMTNNGTDSSHDKQEKNITNNSSSPQKDNAKEKNNTKESSPPKEESKDYVNDNSQDKKPVGEKAGSVDPEVILIMRYFITEILTLLNHSYRF